MGTFLSLGGWTAGTAQHCCACTPTLRVELGLRFIQSALPNAVIESLDCANYKPLRDYVTRMNQEMIQKAPFSSSFEREEK